MSVAIPSAWQRIWHTRLSDAVRGRWNASLHWRAVIANAELPKQVADFVAHVVGGARLWRSEKVEVARELIAHFQDGLDAGRTPQELVDSFGDPAAASRLIRRAKKRGRPIAWHMWRGGWLILGGLCLTYVFAGLYLMTGRPSVKVDYLAMINQQPLAVPEAERAWPLYRDALLAMGLKADSGGSIPSSWISDFDAKPGDAAKSPGPQESIESRMGASGVPVHSILGTEPFDSPQYPPTAPLRVSQLRRWLGDVPMVYIVCPQERAAEFVWLFAEALVFIRPERGE